MLTLRLRPLTFSKRPCVRTTESALGPPKAGTFYTKQLGNQCAHLFVKSSGSAPALLSSQRRARKREVFSIRQRPNFRAEQGLAFHYVEPGFSAESETAERIKP